MDYLFGNPFGFQPPQHNPQQQVHRFGAPPASSKVIQSLVNVKVTADDLIEATNRECAICLDDQVLGSYACKLQCGHLFHMKCLKEWLEKHCTCPTCRLELETDDENFEKERKSRMKSRKPRYRFDELLAKRPSELKEIALFVGVNISNVLDKRDIVNLLVQSGKIDVTEGVPTIELSTEEFNLKSVTELRNLLLSFGLSSEGALEKHELRSRLLESNRVVVKPTATDTGSSRTSSTLSAIPSSLPPRPTVEDVQSLSFHQLKELDENRNLGTKGTDENSTLVSSEASALHHLPATSSTLTNSDVPVLTRNELDELSISDYHHLFTRLGLSTKGLLEKSDMRDRLLQSQRVRLVD